VITRTRVILVAACVLAATSAGSARAATVTIGSDLSGPVSSNSTVSPASTIATVALADRDVTSPVDGTVISWRTKGMSGEFKLRVLHHFPDESLAALGTSPSANPVGPGEAGPFATSLPIHRGDQVGLDFNPAGVMLGVRTPQGGQVAAVAPPIPDGQASSSVNYNTPAEYVYNAVVRYCVVPSLVGKKLGAARSALTAADCTLGGLKPKSKKKRKKAKFVRSQSVTPGASISDTAPIDLVLRKKPAKKK
jgi:hypothetical protein